MSKRFKGKDQRDEAEQTSNGKSFHILVASKVKLAPKCLVDLCKDGVNTIRIRTAGYIDTQPRL